MWSRLQNFLFLIPVFLHTEGSQVTLQVGLCRYTHVRVKSTQGVELHLIQAPMQLNFSLWQPNPEN